METTTTNTETSYSHVGNPQIENLRELLRAVNRITVNQVKTQRFPASDERKVRKAIATYLKASGVNASAADVERVYEALC